MKKPERQVLVALLRGINVGGVKVAMKDLKALVTELGYADVETYVQSGNVVFTANVTTTEAEAAIEKALAERLGVEVPVVVRDGARWCTYAAGSPFTPAETERPHMLHLGLSKMPPREGAVEALAKYCTALETIEIRGDAIFIDFPNGAGRSKLTPNALNRAIGSPVTLRNWKTVQALAALVRRRLSAS
jgi:uncharacterized protein (DUF1697 family)